MRSTCFELSRLILYFYVSVAIVEELNQIYHVNVNNN